MFQFNHFNFNVLDLEKSLKFYKEALGLDVVREKDSSDGSFKIVYLATQADLLLVINPETNKFSNGCVQKAI